MLVGFGLIYRQPLLDCGDSKHSLKLRKGQIRRGRVHFSSLFLEQVGLIALLLLPFLPWRWYQGRVMSHQNAHLCQFGRLPILKWYLMGPFWLSSICYIFCRSLQIDSFHLRRRTIDTYGTYESIDWALLGSLVLPISFTKPPRALLAQESWALVLSAYQKWNFCPQLDLWAPDYFLLYLQIPFQNRAWQLMNNLTLCCRWSNNWPCSIPTGRGGWVALSDHLQGTKPSRPPQAHFLCRLRRLGSPPNQLPALSLLRLPCLWLWGWLQPLPRPPCWRLHAWPTNAASRLALKFSPEPPLGPWLFAALPSQAHQVSPLPLNICIDVLCL